MQCHGGYDSPQNRHAAKLNDPLLMLTSDAFILAPAPSSDIATCGLWYW